MGTKVNTKTKETVIYLTECIGLGILCGWVEGKVFTKLSNHYVAKLSK